ncbi:hypothetical protein GE061_018352 [Apolygus lucorum]|uniref:Uncharacterized protein n=1 Tax=Apolygus lucorum TaxID=248454 RepID=A0A8S9XDT6_APOLU|nr:hypothetical protein GE061_018352 [Apolygus lucorum]
MANILFDGKVYTELLASYGFPIQELKEANDAVGSFDNLKTLNYSLDLIGLQQEDEVLLKIAHRDHLESVKLLLEIYIHLERFWPYSKGSVLGEMTSFPRIQSSRYDEDQSSSDASSTTRIASEMSLSSSSEEGNDPSLFDIISDYKMSTIAACRSEMNAHRKNFGKTLG